MILRLVLAELRHRPGRALFLLGGYSLGVAVMVVLLAVGEAMLEQARDRSLVGGGDVVLVPAGISPEMLKAGGATSLFLGIDHARFVQRRVMESERGREDHGVRAASPVIDGRLLELTAGGRRYAAIATGEVPSRAAMAGASPDLLSGRWRDSPADRRWVDPSPAELYDGIDHFHRPAGAAAGDSTWAEWHYFNVVLAPDRWIYLTLSVGGRVGEPGRWGGGVLLTEREPGGAHRAVTREYPDREVRFDTASADLVLGWSAEVRQEGGVYHVRAALGGDSVELAVRPAPGRYFPPTDLGGGALTSGYVAPALSAEADGVVCLGRPARSSRSARGIHEGSSRSALSGGCERVRRAPAYHDHNWGVWRGVSWEWGSASGPALSLLYGVVRGDSVAERGLFAYLVDGRGVVGVYRPGPLEVVAARDTVFEGARLPIPRRLAFRDARAGLRVAIDVSAVHVTDTGRPRRRYFLQMRGVARVEAPGVRPEAMPGFFETYVDAR